MVAGSAGLVVAVGVIFWLFVSGGALSIYMIKLGPESSFKFLRDLIFYFWLLIFGGVLFSLQTVDILVSILNY